MFEDMKGQIKNWEDENQIQEYLVKILDKNAFDRSGFIYGIGHAIYSISDPRAVIFKGYAQELAKEKGYEQEFHMYELVEKLAPQVISENRRMYKGVSANVDFYSSLVFKMLNIPQELYIPLYAVSRVVGWSAHRLEEMINEGKIIRPAYKCIMPRLEYVPMSDRPHQNIK